MSVTGVLGGRWRADVTAWGDVVPWDGSPPLTWHVAADDRWHSPAEETTVRQRRPGGAAVFETRLRVPGGDVCHRVWSVPDAGGCTVVEVANDSPLPIACAFTRTDVVTARPPTDVPIQGIDLPATTIVVPIGHRTSARVALRHRPDGRTVDLAGLAPAEAVERGWVGVAERASRLVLPDATLGDDVVAARCDVLLTGPPSLDDPVGHLLGLFELARLGEIDQPGLAGHAVAIADSVHVIARRGGWDVDAALDAAAGLLARAADRRAVGDVERLVAARASASPPPPSAIGVRAIAAVERRLARGGVLLPDGIPAAWRGAPVEGHGLAAGPAATVSFAVRWHADRPAILWDVTGDAVELTAPAVDPAWRATAPSGEALLAPQPPVRAERRVAGAPAVSSVASAWPARPAPPP